jgi:hypothetical protein
VVFLKATILLISAAHKTDSVETFLEWILNILYKNVFEFDSVACVFTFKLALELNRLHLPRNTASSMK